MNEFTFHVVIPARFASTRLSGKLLMDIGGQSILQRVYHQVQQAQPASIVIATDDEKIYEHALSLGAPVKMTAAHHQSGTDRIVEIIENGHYDREAIIINVQGDEPFIAPALIRQAAQLLHTAAAPVATLCWPITTVEQLNNPHVVKVVFNQLNHAMYFSRSAIPAHRDHPGNITGCYRHIGLYAYRASFLRLFTQLPSCTLEQAECLEQLRILWAGYPIAVAVAEEEPKQDINTLDDLLKANAVMSI